MAKDAGDIKHYYLNTALYREHKEGPSTSDFGMDRSNELVEGGFGLYSTADLKAPIGPVRASYFRISLVLSGRVNISCGLENYQPSTGHVIAGFPRQIFRLYDPDRQFKAYYMLFTEEFISAAIPLKKLREQCPFLAYSGMHSFALAKEDAEEVLQCMLKINAEIKANKIGLADVIRLHVQLVLMHLRRSYEQLYPPGKRPANSNSLFHDFAKLVGQHFLTRRKVADYAAMLYVSADHLNKVIRQESGKTAHELVDEMLLMEAKACLRQTTLSVSEVAYRLQFTDPSHFNKFFKKLQGCTPLQYRTSSD